MAIHWVVAIIRAVLKALFKNTGSTSRPNHFSLFLPINPITTHYLPYSKPGWLPTPAWLVIQPWVEAQPVLHIYKPCKWKILQPHLIWYQLQKVCPFTKHCFFLRGNAVVVGVYIIILFIYYLFICIFILLSYWLTYLSGLISLVALSVWNIWSFPSGAVSSPTQSHARSQSRVLPLPVLVPARQER